MKKLFKKYFWTAIIVFSALGLAGSAAYFSISGLSKLFAGASIQIIIMASFIELAKIITTAALHRYWNEINRVLKWVLSFMVVIVMLITSSGIYGFLADAYTKTSTQIDKIDGKIALIEKKKKQKNSQIISLQSVKDSKDKRINSLINIRGQQESRIDALYKKNKGTNGAQSMIQQSNSEIKTLQIEVDTLVAKIDRFSFEISNMDTEILELQSSDVASEIGPLKYMSNVVGSPMENIINWFIMMIIFVFDPLAILLIILANNVYDKSTEVYREEKAVEEAEEDKEKPSNEELYNKENQVDIDYLDSVKLDNQDFSDSIVQEKGGQVVEYIEGEGGKFEKSNEEKKSISSIIKDIDSNPLYLQLIDVLFINGQRSVGDTMPSYEMFLKDVINSGIDCSEKIIKNFLTISNLLGIVNMADENNVVIIKDYESSKQIISLVSK
jgi:cell division protein FtsL